MTTLASTNTYHNQVHKFFEKTADKKARETKFVQRQSPITGRLFLLTLVLNVLQSGQIVLPQLAKTAGKISSAVKVCGQAFKERFNEFAVEFMKAMFAESLKVTAPNEAQIVPLNRISGLVEEHLGGKCSPTKLWRRMQDDREDLLKALGQGTAQSLDQTLKFISRFARPSPRKKYPSTLQRLKQAAKEARQVKLKDPLGYLRKKKKTAAERNKAFARSIERRQVSFDLKQLNYQRTAALP